MAQSTPRRIEVGTGAAGWAAAIDTLGLPAHTTAVVINGETGDNSGFPAGRVRETLRSVVRELAGCSGPVLVSGGTRAGIFALLGEVVSEFGFAGPVIGVVPAGKINRTDSTPLEPHHTDVLMVDGQAWGDETPTMLALCRELDRRGPVVALVAGGGRQTTVEVEGHRADRRPVVVLRGTGRAADELAARRPSGVAVLDLADARRVGEWRALLQAGRS